MPRFDGTGPTGRGAKTGRGLGYCTHFSRITTCCNFCSRLLFPMFRRRRINFLRRNRRF